MSLMIFSRESTKNDAIELSIWNLQRKSFSLKAVSSNKLKKREREGFFLII